jgi:hypothetical protein
MVQEERSSTSSSLAPEKASEVDQKDAPPLKEETPWPCKGKSFIYYIFIELLVVASHVLIPNKSLHCTTCLVFNKK